MQVNDIRKKYVGQIIWLQFTFKVRTFYCAQFIFGDRDKKTCISNTVWATKQCQVFLESWERLCPAGLFLKLLGYLVLPQTWFKVGPYSAKSNKTLHAVFEQTMTAKMLILIYPCRILSQHSKKVWHYILAQRVPKLLAF